jgi:hypothetical protein
MTGSGGRSTFETPFARIVLPQISSVLHWQFAFSRSSSACIVAIRSASAFNSINLRSANRRQRASARVPSANPTKSALISSSVNPAWRARWTTASRYNTVHSSRREGRRSPGDRQRGRTCRISFTSWWVWTTCPATCCGLSRAPAFYVVERADAATFSLSAVFGGVTTLKILPSGSLNQAVLIGPATWISPCRVIFGKS